MSTVVGKKLDGYCNKDFGVKKKIYSHCSCNKEEVRSEYREISPIKIMPMFETDKILKIINK